VSDMADRTPLESPDRSRDDALRLTRRLTGLVVAGAAALTGGLALASAHAFDGHGHKPDTRSARPSARVADTVPAPQSVPPVSGQDRIRPPATVPSSPPATSTPTPAPTPAPAPTPPVSSGGS
jgi:hypothetical protein